MQNAHNYRKFKNRSTTQPTVFKFKIWVPMCDPKITKFILHFLAFSIKLRTAPSFHFPNPPIVLFFFKSFYTVIKASGAAATKLDPSLSFQILNNQTLPFSLSSPSPSFFDGPDGPFPYLSLPPLSASQLQPLPLQPRAESSNGTQVIPGPRWQAPLLMDERRRPMQWEL